ncbi:MAG TPA: hypothetical protein VG167_12875 [Verrucomicrobiae bacterium]|nr:hypothetical protein [Verrucomicrobiae bacterium]
MSLKAFHVVFITAASALAVGFGVWELKDYTSAGGNGGELVMSIGSFVVGLALIGYEAYFLKKLKKVSYL